ncbi:FAD-binding oxidoreductase [Natronosporangium hydrolyticum]|uniref:FAD-binding oxidoreductase n=1 Tax=Natronosporangium hydrolyticum TaxID=2811111 RepID=A0A895YRI4_9ACTN|nr:FAD-binding oxidoreductase [Natronosporangium hydrolyticum]QSB16628.1 FAD-binding oxidoreductase [Natronosporangium hydrolyticum]
MATTAPGWRELATTLDGSLVRPDDTEFSSLRRPFVGGLTEVLPQAVVRCAGAPDVARAVTFARKHRLPVAIRSGGHSFADHCATDGLLIDLGRLDTVALAGETATIGPGVRLGPLAQRLAVQGRIVSCGWNPLVAVGGAVLGGGFGVLSRRFGLGCDQLLAAQVVLADGDIVWVDEQREPDLFWALRGAGWAGFGVVTALVLRTFPVQRMCRFVHRWPWADAAALIDAWQRWAPHAPDHLNAEVAIQSADPSADPKVTLFGATLGRADAARAALAEFLASAAPGHELDELTELSPAAAPLRHSYAGAAVLEHPQPGPPAGLRPLLRAVKSEFFDTALPEPAITALLANFAADRRPAQYRELEFIPWGGMIGKPDPGATAFTHRNQLFQIGHHGMVPNPAGDDARAAARGWAKRSWRSVHPWAAGGVYPNYPDADLPDWARAYYGDNLPRLTEVKARYDPDDVFHFAQSIPATAGAPRHRADGGPDRGGSNGPATPP